MIATQCPTQDTLHALSVGRLAESQSEPLLQHLRDCPRCRSELETLQDADDSVIALLRQPNEFCEYDIEPDYKRAVARALGALAIAGERAPDSDWQQLPATIGEYEIVRPLGRGGMGRVFLARHSKLGRQVALKLALIDRLADPRVRRRFEAEMRAVGKLSHPNIVTAHDAREIDGTAVLVTEYIDGFDLAQLVRRTGPLAIPDACAIVCRVAAALQYTADEGFVHRDVKPSNIMLSSDGQVKLLDLGLARFHSNEDAAEMTGTGQAMGTADYVAPEQVTDGRNVDVRADIYSLGCTLFHLLTAAPPFPNEDYPTAFAKMNAHVSTAAPSLASRRSDCPADVARLVDAMLAKQPDLRPSRPDDVASGLEKHAAGADLQALAARAAELPPGVKSEAAPRPSAAARPKPLPWMRRKIPATIAIAAGLLGFAAGLALGIIITITRPDGSKVVVTAPEGSDIVIREAEAVPASASTKLPVAEKASDPDGAAVAPAESAALKIAPLNRYPGYFRVQTSRGTSGRQDKDGNPIDHVVVERGRLHLLQDNKLVASGRLEPGQAAESFVFHDEIGGVSVTGVYRPLGREDPSGEPALWLQLIFDSANVPTSRLNDYPLVLPMKLILSQLTGSAAAAVEAVLREQRTTAEHSGDVDAPTPQLPEDDVDIRDAEAVPAEPPVAENVIGPDGVAVAPAASAAFNRYQGYWQVLADRQTDDSPTNLIDHVVVEDGRLHLLQDDKLVASGRLTAGREDEFDTAFVFSDQIGGVSVVGHFAHGDPFRGPFREFTYLQFRDFENLANVPTSRLNNYPLVFPTTLKMSPLTGSAAAAVEAVLREQRATTERDSDVDAPRPLLPEDGIDIREDPVSFDDVDPRSDRLRTLRRVGDVPQTAADVAALQCGQPPEVAPAMEHLWNLLSATGDGPAGR